MTTCHWQAHCLQNIVTEPVWHYHWHCEHVHHSLGTGLCSKGVVAWDCKYRNEPDYQFIGAQWWSMMERIILTLHCCNNNNVITNICSAIKYIFTPSPIITGAWTLVLTSSNIILISDVWSCCTQYCCVTPPSSESAAAGIIKIVTECWQNCHLLSYSDRMMPFITFQGDMHWLNWIVKNGTPSDAALIGTEFDILVLTWWWSSSSCLSRSSGTIIFVREGCRHLEPWKWCNQDDHQTGGNQSEWLVVQQHLLVLSQ